MQDVWMFPFQYDGEAQVLGRRHRCSLILGRVLQGHWQTKCRQHLLAFALGQCPLAPRLRLLQKRECLTYRCVGVRALGERVRVVAQFTVSVQGMDGCRRPRGRPEYRNIAFCDQLASLTGEISASPNDYDGLVRRFCNADEIADGRLVASGNGNDGNYQLNALVVQEHLCAASPEAVITDGSRCCVERILKIPFEAKLFGYSAFGLD